jgi:predicted GIY-YIG superfamily endonuclease
VFGAGDIIHAETHHDLRAAVARERQLKGWRRAKKIALANGQLELLKSL